MDVNKECEAFYAPWIRKPFDREIDYAPSGTKAKKAAVCGLKFNH